jgi:hypothetical protein
MSVSLRGELTETTRTHFEHPSRSGVLTPELSSLTALGYAIQNGNLQGTRDIIRGEPRWLLNDADYQLNSPVVSTSCFLIRTASQRLHDYLCTCSRPGAKTKEAFVAHQGTGSASRYRKSMYCKIRNLRRCNCIRPRRDKGRRCRRQNGPEPNNCTALSQHTGNTKLVAYL